MRWHHALKTHAFIQDPIIFSETYFRKITCIVTEIPLITPSVTSLSHF